MEVEAIAQALNLSIPTAYRYVRELTATGILVKFGNEYGLGPRIIQLDLQMRKCDKLLQIGGPIANELAEFANCNVLLTSMYGKETINIYETSANSSIHPTFGRGHKMPFAKGASSRAILAFTKRPKLKRMYDAITEPSLDWKELQQILSETRRRGYELSFGELDNNLFGIAAPILDNEGYACAAITLVMKKNRAKIYHSQALGEHLIKQASRITEQIFSTAIPVE